MSKLTSNPLVLIVLGLILGVGTGVVSFKKMAAPLVAQARAGHSHASHVEKPEAPWDFWTTEIDNLSNELKDSKLSIKKRDEELTAREARLIAERQELAKQRQDLEAMRSEITTRIGEIQTDEVKNLKSLANLYSNLTPKATLTIFKEMDDVTVVKLLSLMKTDVVSPLFEEMGKQAASDPTLAKKAAALSEKLRLFKSGKTASSP